MRILLVFSAWQKPRFDLFWSFRKRKSETLFRGFRLIFPSFVAINLGLRQKWTYQSLINWIGADFVFDNCFVFLFLVSSLLLLLGFRKNQGWGFWPLIGAIWVSYFLVSWLDWRLLIIFLVKTWNLHCWYIVNLQQCIYLFESASNYVIYIF